MKSLSAVVLGCCVLFASASFINARDDHEGGHDEDGHSHAVELPQVGTAVLVPTAGNKVRGTLKLMQMGDDLKITGKVRNLTPGEHGFHIHEFGDLRGSDGKAAGGHFNPYGTEHGAPGEHAHVGDFGNITADESGVADVKLTSKGTALHFVLGRSFVVHADRDDLSSQPSGNAGPRVAVGVIGVGNPDFKFEPKKAN